MDPNSFIDDDFVASSSIPGPQFLVINDNDVTFTEVQQPEYTGLSSDNRMEVESPTNKAMVAEIHPVASISFANVPKRKMQHSETVTSTPMKDVFQEVQIKRVEKVEADEKRNKGKNGLKKIHGKKQ